MNNKIYTYHSRCSLTTSAYAAAARSKQELIEYLKAHANIDRLNATEAALDKLESDGQDVRFSDGLHMNCLVSLRDFESLEFYENQPNQSN